MDQATVAEILALNLKLLKSIAEADWATYEGLCDPNLTCFEPEGRGHLIEGMPFHRYYFELGGARKPFETTMSSPRVHLVGDVAVLAYVRLNQRTSDEGQPATIAVEETRVWQRRDGKWKHIHFHRSLPS